MHIYHLQYRLGTEYYIAVLAHREESPKPQQFSLLIFIAFAIAKCKLYITCIKQKFNNIATTAHL